jgi:glycerol uptake facilitator-like aquaporin
LSRAGSAFNPARVFGPALLQSEWHAHWVYWLADLAGAALAVGVRKLYMHFFEDVHVTSADVRAPSD